MKSSEISLKFYLNKISESLERILNYISDYSFETFIESEITKDAVVRNFGIIANVFSQIDFNDKSKFPQIDFSLIAKIRDAIQDYTDIDYNFLWDLSQNHLQELQFQVKNLLADIDSQNSNKK